MADILDVWLAKTRIGQLTLLPGDRTFFVFEEEYLNNSNRPVLSQSFFTGSGELIPETRTYKTKVPPFFSNLLPEGHLRTSIPAGGVGGDWIVKLPAQNFAQVPENEWAMLHLAKEVGISVPETDLVPLEKIAGLPELGFLSGNLALAIKRFDRNEKQRIHIEDFAQVYNVFPNDKYNKVSYDNITNMIWA